MQTVSLPDPVIAHLRERREELGAEATEAQAA
jgi:hypothetical protein